MKLPHLRSEQIKTQPDQTSALINKIIDRVNDPNLGGGGGGGGTSDFNELTNRPSYAGTTMTGSTNIPAVPTKTSQLNNDSGFVNTTDLTNAISNHNTSGTAHSDIRNSITSLSNSVTAIQNVIPTAATANNKLTDKDYVDDSINSVTAYYITKNAAGDAFATKAELNSATVFYSGGQVRIPTRNDYCIVEADESKQDPITGEDPTTRYIYNNGWEFQYIVNKTALTADQLAALNSGVTAADVTKLSGIEAGAEVNVQSDWSISDNTSDAYIKNKPTIGDATLTITQNGTSVGTFTANATSDVTLALTDTLYNDFTGATNITAGAHGLVIAPAAGDQMKALYGDGTWKLAHMTIAAYGKSTYAEILAAYKANNIIYCRASSNSNPGTGNQLRMAFLAYVNNEATPTEFEFQYYRSVATHTDAQQGDQVYVYKINSAGTWSVTVREAYTKVNAGTNMTSSYSSGTITLNATDTTYSDFTGATSGTAGAHGLVPAPAAGDENKVLKGNGTWATLSSHGGKLVAFNLDPNDTSHILFYSDKACTDQITNPYDDVYGAALDGERILFYDCINGGLGGNEYTYLTTSEWPDSEAEMYIYGLSYDGNDLVPDPYGIAKFEFSYGQQYAYILNYNAAEFQPKLTAGSNIQINGTTISATDTTYSDMVGATSSVAGAAGLAPQPIAGDQDKVLKGDGTWDTVDPEGLTDGNMYDKFVALDGTEITANTDLNTVALCNAGMYYCPTNATVSTLTNCPTGNAFTMRVYMPNADAPKDPAVDAWVYTVREITDIAGKRWIQRAQQINGTPNDMRYYDWERITTGYKVDIASTDIENYSGTILGLVKGIYPEGYHRWFTETNGGTASITDKPTGSTNAGFILEAFKVRDYTTTDYAYRLVCRTAGAVPTYETYVGYSTSSITWYPNVYINDGIAYVSHGMSNKDAAFDADRTDTGVGVRMGVGAGGTNHGLWSKYNSRWLVVSDTSNGCYLNGDARFKKNDTYTLTSQIVTGYTGGTADANINIRITVPKSLSGITNIAVTASTGSQTVLYGVKAGVSSLLRISSWGTPTKLNDYQVNLPAVLTASTDNYQILLAYIGSLKLTFT